MPNIITLPTATPTGYGQLGQVLLGASSDYAHRQQQLQDEERRRQEQLATHQLLRGEQLADVGSERAYQDQRYTTQRKDRVTDIEAEKLFAAKTEMMRLGLLKPEDFDKPDAVNAALGQMRNDGLLTKYQGALQSGDLSYADLASGNAEKINAGLAKFSSRAAKETGRRKEMTAGGSAQAADVQRQMRELDAQEQGIQRKMLAIQTDGARRPTPQEIERRAIEVAGPRASKPGFPTPKEIANALPEAEASLIADRREQLGIALQSLKSDVALIGQTKMSLRNQADTLANKGMFAPASSFTTPAAPSPVSDVNSAVDPNAVRAATRQKLLGGGRGVADIRMEDQRAVASMAPAPTADAVFGNLENVGVFTRPMTQNGRVRSYAPVTPDMVQSARTAVQAEIDRLGAMPQNRAVPGRLQMLASTLSDLDTLQRGTDQQATQDAQLLQEPPDSNAAETTPRVPAIPFSNFATPRAWWTPQPAMGL